ncbi:MAG: Forkhead-associated protein [Gemmatimonadetes bacterium]|nr:Forkhead-associated protein [Gemmatimonadota bacterium]
MIVVAVLLLAVAAAASVSLFRWRAERRAAHAPIPLIFPMNAGIAWESTYSAQPVAPPVRTVEAPVDESTFESTFAPPIITEPVRTASERPVSIPLSADRDSLVPVGNETVRFHRPTEDLVQLLPGHLEVLAGDSRHQEIRFVRVQGQLPHLILGRNPGRSPQHIALNSSTVSRQHARLAFAGGKWAVANLSMTNPVVVNDEELSNVDGERPLVDGDRIELGEVVLRFHAQ